MKLSLLFSSIVAICLADPQYLQNYGIRRNLRSQAYSIKSLASKVAADAIVPSSILGTCSF